jgi:hypothetical protein
MKERNIEVVSGDPRVTRVTATKPPKRFKIGSSAVYIQIAEVARLLGIEDRHVRTLCAYFDPPIPVLSFHGQSTYYVLVYALETALFALGLPKAIRDDPALSRAHQELAGVLYGGLTRQALTDRVELLAKTLTSASTNPKMYRDHNARKKWTGRNMRSEKC